MPSFNPPKAAPRVVSTPKARGAKVIPIKVGYNPSPKIREARDYLRELAESTAFQEGLKRKGVKPTDLERLYLSILNLAIELDSIEKEEDVAYIVKASREVVSNLPPPSIARREVHTTTLKPSNKGAGRLWRDW